MMKNSFFSTKRSLNEVIIITTFERNEFDVLILAKYVYNCHPSESFNSFFVHFHTIVPLFLSDVPMNFPRNKTNIIKIHC